MGWHVGVAARREEPLKNLSDRYPGTVSHIAMDVTADDAEQKFKDLLNLTGGMDILLYSAGTGRVNAELSTADDLNTVAVNISGFTKIINAAYRYFRNRTQAETGQIAAITSIAATKGIGIAASYSATKRYQTTYLDAIDQLARIQHVNLRITDIRPGFVKTDLLKDKHRYPMLMNVERTARFIEKAVINRKRVYIIDYRWAILTALWNAIPNPIWRRLHIKFRD